MIEYFEALKAIAINAMFNPAFLALLLILFFVGRFFGKLTKRVRFWKVLVLGYFALFLYAPVRDAGPILGGILIAGILSNHVGSLFSVLGWAGNLSEVFFAFRYRSAFEEIKRREQEIEERERKLRDAELRNEHERRHPGGRTEQGWKQEAKNFRQKPDAENARGSSSTSSEHRDDGCTGAVPPPTNDLRSKHLKALGLTPGKNYGPDEIKKAYRRMMMMVHPDVGGSQVEFIAVQNAYEWLSAKF